MAYPLRWGVALTLGLACLSMSAGDVIPEHQRRQIWDAAPAKAQATPKQPRRVLIWCTPTHLMEKDPHKGYCIPYGAAALEAIGCRSGAFEPLISDDLSAFLPENLRAFDAVVLNNSSGAWITPTPANLATDPFRALGADPAAVEPALRRSFLDYVANGGGVVALHFAIAANAHWPEFQQLIGARFAGRTQPAPPPPRCGRQSRKLVAYVCRHPPRQHAAATSKSREWPKCVWLL